MRLTPKQTMPTPEVAQCEYLRIWGSTGLKYVYLPGQAPSSQESEPASPTMPDARMNIQGANAGQACDEQISQPIRSVWTYRELDQDLLAPEGNPRLQLLRAIMEAKQLDQKQNPLWPIAGHDRKGRESQAGLTNFIDRLKRHNPGHVFCFGMKTYESIDGHLRKTGQKLPSSCRLVPLPSLDEMLPDNKAVKTITWNLLKDIDI